MNDPPNVNTLCCALQLEHPSYQYYIRYAFLKRITLGDRINPRYKRLKVLRLAKYFYGSDTLRGSDETYESMI